MIFTSLKFPSVVLGSVLAVSASYAVAERGIPGLPLPPFPTVADRGIPGLPLPPFPTVNVTVASGIPGLPLPPFPTGSVAI